MYRLIVVAGKISLGTLYLDHPRARIRQAARTQWRCHGLLDGDYEDAGKGFGGQEKT
jgi:hypothetical protein